MKSERKIIGIGTLVFRILGLGAVLFASMSVFIIAPSTLKAEALSKDQREEKSALIQEIRIFYSRGHIPNFASFWPDPVLDHIATVIVANPEPVVSSDRMLLSVEFIDIYWSFKTYLLCLDPKEPVLISFTRDALNALDVNDFSSAAKSVLGIIDWKLEKARENPDMADEWMLDAASDLAELSYFTQIMGTREAMIEAASLAERAVSLAEPLDPIAAVDYRLAQAGALFELDRMFGDQDSNLTVLSVLEPCDSVLDPVLYRSTLSALFLIRAEALQRYGFARDSPDFLEQAAEFYKKGFDTSNVRSKFINDRDAWRTDLRSGALNEHYFRVLGELDRRGVKLTPTQRRERVKSGRRLRAFQSDYTLSVETAALAFDLAQSLMALDQEDYPNNLAPEADYSIDAFDDPTLSLDDAHQYYNRAFWAYVTMKDRDEKNRDMTLRSAYGMCVTAAQKCDRHYANGARYTCPSRMTRECIDLADLLPETSQADDIRAAVSQYEDAVKAFESQSENVRDVSQLKDAGRTFYTRIKTLNSLPDQSR